MTKYYYTSESDDGKIDENADIAVIEAASEAEAKTLILAKLGDGFDPTDRVEIIEGYFSDCWIKTRHPEGCDTSPFSVDDLYIQRPSEHPGLSGYTWITPRPPVYIMQLAREID